MTKKFTKFDTLCAQAGWDPKNGESRIPPISQSTTFKYDSPDTVANLFDLKEEGYFYTRIANPTVDALEKKNCGLRWGHCSSGNIKWASSKSFGSFKYC